VPNLLSISVSGAVGLGTLEPAKTADYTASVTATVTSTIANSALTVGDASDVATGHLTNGAFALPSPLQLMATDAAHPTGAFAPVTSLASPLTLLSWTTPVSDDAVTVTVKQSVAATDPLLGGTYSKTLTFTLASTTP